MVGGAASLALALLIAVSPALVFLVSFLGYDWAVLSNVGQSYGLVATILSGAALLGVLLTVNMQREQTRLLGEQAVRQLHFSLMQQAWEDPVLLESMTVVPHGQRDRARQFVFVNYYFMYMQLGYRSNGITLAEIEDLAAYSFSTSGGRYYWERSQSHMKGHFEKEFISALERGYERARAAPEGLFVDPPSDDEEAADA